MPERTVGFISGVWRAKIWAMEQFMDLQQCRIEVSRRTFASLRPKIRPLFNEGQKIGVLFDIPIVVKSNISGWRLMFRDKQVKKSVLRMIDGKPHVRG